MPSIALVDCNNFYASCERVFNPQLRNKPLVVLSNNDGCIIARSTEAKTLGIPMGAPYFQWADFIRHNGVTICSSNYSLYGDLSHRVMRILERFNPDVEIYSIDEAFVDMRGVADPAAHCRQMRETLLQWTGIPVSIGVAPTKTLAKIATRSAKKLQGGVYFPSQGELSPLLDRLPVRDIWGIGRRLTTFLAKKGIRTAAALRDCPDSWVQKTLTVVGLRTVWELRGIPCFSFDEEPPAKQSIMTSRSFSRSILEKGELDSALASFAARAGEKLREERRVASWLQVFINGKEEGWHLHFVLPEPTSYTPTLIDYAKRGVAALYRPGCVYKKGGILLGGLVPEEAYQRDLFVDPTLESKQKSVMALIDRANDRFGSSTLKFAAEGWQSKREHRSPCFTTRWDELLTIRI